MLIKNFPLMKLLLYLFISSILLTKTLTTFDLNSLTTTSITDPIDKVLTIKGKNQDSLFGSYVGDAGDINGDGINDVIVSDSAPSGQRTVSVIYGKQSLENIDLSSNDLDPQTTGFTITKTVARFGHSVNGAGDVNNDGYADIIIGSPSESSAYVIYGNVVQNLKNIDLDSETLEPLKTGFTVTGTTGDGLGYSVHGAGDINNDGYPDIVCGAYVANSDVGSQVGKAHVIYGKPTSNLINYPLETITLDPGTTGFTVTGEAASNHFGAAVSGAGDVNHDGYDDIIIGADLNSASRGAAYVIYGKRKDKLKDINLASTSLVSTDTGFKIRGGVALGQFGRIVASAGDINKDGYADVIIGAPNENGNTGGVYVIYGNKKENLPDLDLSLSTALSPQTNGFYIKGETASDQLGYPVNSAGDINKDGYQDIIFGGAGNTGSPGKMYVIYGKPKENLTNFDLATQKLEPTSTGFEITGLNSGDSFGTSVSTAGDFNGDGRIEILVGASGFDSSRGAAYVIFPTRKNSFLIFS